MIKEYLLSENQNLKLAPHFALKEFQCKDGSDLILIDDIAPIKLENARSDCGNLPLKIISAYRTEEYNNQCGGANGSYHKRGMAFDIECPKGMKLEIFAIILARYFNGIILYHNYNMVHADTRDERYIAFNN